MQDEVLRGQNMIADGLMMDFAIRPVFDDEMVELLAGCLEQLIRGCKVLAQSNQFRRQNQPLIFTEQTPRRSDHRLRGFG